MRFGESEGGVIGVVARDGREDLHDHGLSDAFAVNEDDPVFC